MKLARRLLARLFVAAAWKLLKFDEREPFDADVSRFVDELIEIEEQFKKGDA